MTPKYIKALEARDESAVRLFLSSELLLDPRGRSFHEMLKLAESSLPNLYEELDGIIETKPESEWDNDYLYDIKHSLDCNFCRERLLHYEQVAQVVLKSKAEKISKQEEDNSANENMEKASVKKDSPNATLPNGLIVGGVAVTLLAALTRSLPVGLVGVASIVAGVYLKNKK